MTDIAPQTARTPEQIAAQKSRNRWLALALVAFVVLVGVTTIIRLQSADLSADGGFYFDGSMDPREAAPPAGEPVE